MWPRSDVSMPNEALIYPIHPSAVLFSLIAFPSWMLCVIPIVCHFSKPNIAAGSLVLWITMNNFFNSINPMIWSRDNIDEWWDGEILCDIEVRIQVASTVSIAACTVMIVRKLAKVMDTRNITMSTGDSEIKENILEILWCWAYPMVMIIVYYVVQPARYMLIGIVGCISEFDISWPSMVLSFMWAPITMLVAAFYATIVVYRLYCYRREFNRLLSDSNTSKSGFVRLLIICTFVIMIYLPSSVAMVCSRWSVTAGHYSWKEVHGSHFNEIDKILTPRGELTLEKWSQVISGYVAFFVFGTSTDAHNMHKKIFLKLGLGKVFPSLFVTRESASEGSLLRRLVAARTWSSNLSSRAKSKFQSKASSLSSSINSSIYRASMRFDLSALHSVVTEKRTPTPSQENTKQGPLATVSSFFKRIFYRAKNHGPVLPLFFSRTPTESIDSSSTTKSSPSTKGSPSSSARTQARASDTTTSTQTMEPSSVRVMQEVHQNRHGRERADSLPNYTYRWI